MMWRLAACLALLTLGACDTVPLEADNTPTRAQISDSTLPPIKMFGAPNPQAPQRSNADMARDFLDLHFQLEGGSTLPVFSRFETPITVLVTGQPGPTLNQDLARLLDRLQREAGIDISRINAGTAHITIESVSRAQIRKALPKAACFVVPNVSSLEDYRRNRRRLSTDWSQLRNRSQMAIFVPNDVSPQELRDCLHEELAQAIGPLNDLYRLPDSVFNDDNVHTVLTGFDMLMLRATYAPELQTGMSRQQVAAALPAILARYNPRGQSLGASPLRETPRGWIDNIITALSPGNDLEGRQRAANAATATAQRLGWQDHRRSFSHYTLGRMLQPVDPELAQQHYRTAMSFVSQSANTELHRVRIASRLATYQIERGNGAAALDLLAPHLPVARRFENAALLSTLMLLQAEALDLVGRDAQARSVRLDSLGWARYGFGSDWTVRTKMEEVAALRPRN